MTDPQPTYNPDQIRAMLDTLAEIQAQIAGLNVSMALLRDAAMAPIKAELEAITAEYAPPLEAAHARAADLESIIRTQIVGQGISIKGEALHAVYTPGRITWDTSRLEGYAVAHPEINDWRKQGAPSVAIRTVKK